MNTYAITDQQIHAVWNMIKKFPGEDVIPIYNLLTNLKLVNQEIQEVKHKQE